MKTRVLSGRTDTYRVLAPVWIWVRLRVQTWDLGVWKLPRTLCMLLPLGLGWGGDSEPGKNSLFWLPRVNRAGEAGVVGD